MMYPEGHYRCNICDNDFPQPPYFIAYSYVDPAIYDKIVFPPEYYEAQEEFRKHWEQIPEGSHPIKPKISSKDYEYMLNVQMNANYITYIELCENCSDDFDDWADEQRVKHQNR